MRGHGVYLHALIFAHVCRVHYTPLCTAAAASWTCTRYMQRAPLNMRMNVHITKYTTINYGGETIATGFAWLLFPLRMQNGFILHELACPESSRRRSSSACIRAATLISPGCISFRFGITFASDTLCHVNDINLVRPPYQNNKQHAALH